MSWEKGGPWASSFRRKERRGAAAEPAGQATGAAIVQPVEVEINHGCGQKGQHLADHQPADDRDAQRLAQFAPLAQAQRQGHRAHDGGAGGHQDRAEAQHAGLVDRVTRRQALLALGDQREVDDHDGVLLHDADQEDHPDQRDDREVHVEDHQRQHRAHAGRRQGGQHRQRVDVALVEHAEHDVDRDQGGGDQQRLVGQRLLEHLGGALEAALHGGRHPDGRDSLGDGGLGVAERFSGGQVERQGSRGRLALVVDRQGRVLQRPGGDGRQGDHGLGRGGDGHSAGHRRGAAGGGARGARASEGGAIGRPGVGGAGRVRAVGGRADHGDRRGDVRADGVGCDAARKARRG